MRIVFRVDSSVEMGSGHVMRCLTLAESLIKRGAKVSFVCRELPGNLCGFIEQKGFMVNRLPYNLNSEEKRDIYVDPPHANWLGVDWKTDASQTSDILNHFGKIDWLVVDHYALDVRWEQVLSSYTDAIMAIDDLADRHHQCDILLDQNLYPEMENRYKGLVPKQCKQLLGPKFALLREEFRNARSKGINRNGKVERIIVFFGGTDPTNETRKALDAVEQSGMAFTEIHVIVGEANPQKDTIKLLCESIEGVKFYCQTNKIADLMHNADLALCAGGSSTWERCCLGLPSIVLAIADNQIKIAQMTEEVGAIAFLGYAADVSKTHLAETLRKLSGDKMRLQKMSRVGVDLVDGMGVERVVKEMGLKYRIHIVSDKNSWLNEYIPQLILGLKSLGCLVYWTHDFQEINKGDFAFYLSCGQITSPEVLEKNKHNLVVHESKLPLGKGWSPLTWQIIEGKNEIPITLFEAVKDVDSGPVYLRDTMIFDGSELIDELRMVQARCTIKLCMDFIKSYPDSVADGEPQTGKSTFYRRRWPEDSCLEVDKTIKEQFNLLRTVDNKRYPAYFELNGSTYILKIEKMPNQKSEVERMYEDELQR